MTVSGHALSRIAEAVGTPFYCYDAAVLRSRVAQVRAALPETDLYFSLKANPNRSVVETICGAGAKAEICSLGELEIALAAGVAPADLIYVGPAKGTAALARALEAGVGVIVAESVEELELVNALARDRHMRQPVALRLNPSFTTSSAKLAMSGRATQFGIDSTDLDRALARVAGLPHLRLHGLHVYMGTRILDHRAIADNTRRILDLADTVAARTGAPLDLIDVGGGFGVPYFDRETPLDLDALSAALAPDLSSHRQAHPHTRIAFELGRYLTAPAGVFVTRVVTVKQVKGKAFAICDGGSNCHSAAAGFGSAFRKNFPVSVPGRMDGSTSPWTLTGPLCTPTDVIGQDVELPDIREGDLICLHQSGAYGPSASPVHFLSFGHPAEVMVDGDRTFIARAAETPAQLLDSQIPRPPPPSTGPRPGEALHEPA